MCRGQRLIDEREEAGLLGQGTSNNGQVEEEGTSVFLNTIPRLRGSSWKDIVSKRWLLRCASGACRDGPACLFRLCEQRDVVEN